MMGNYLTIIYTQLLTKVQVSTPEMNVGPPSGETTSKMLYVDQKC